MWQELLSRLNPSMADLFIVFMGLMVVGYILIIKKQSRRDLDDARKRHRREINELKDINKDLSYKYSVLNTWVFAADKIGKFNMLKTGNSQGDVMLDWEGVPTLREKVDV